MIIGTFEIDQEFLSLEAWRLIKEGTLSLIGAGTSFGGLYIGPFYTYFIAGIMSLTRFYPPTLNLVSALWATAVPVGLYFIGRQLFSRATGLIAGLMAAISISFLSLTDTPPLVVPFGLVSLLTFYCLSQLKIGKFMFFAAVTLAGISLHLHFTGLYLSLFILLWILITHYQLKLKDYLIALGILIFFLSPLIIFDLRHDFLNSRNFITFILTTNGLKVILKSLGHGLILSLTSLGAVFNNFQAYNLIAGSLAWLSFIIYFFRLKTKTTAHYLLLSWLVFPIALNGLYTGRLLPYYYTFHHPQTFLALGLVLAKFTRHLWGCTILITLGLLFMILNLTWLKHHPNAFSLSHKMAAFTVITRHAGTTDINVSFTVEHSRRGGLDFLRRYYGFDSELKPNRPTYTIISPFFYERLVGDYQFGEIGVLLPPPQP